MISRRDPNEFRRMSTKIAAPRAWKLEVVSSRPKKIAATMTA
jgi:hypothetical protein